MATVRFKLWLKIAKHDVSTVTSAWTSV